MKTVKIFTAPWCGPCKSFLQNSFPTHKENNPDVTFEVIDIDENFEEPQKFNVRGVPTVVLLEDGVEILRGAGASQINDVFKNL